MTYPAYLKAYETKELQKKADLAMASLEKCDICPRNCGVNRLQEKMGFCRSGSLAKVYSASVHFGEEPPISGENGSGTIFFSGCSSRCVYCQNYKFSRQGQGEEVSPAGLAEIMLKLQKKGCHNINLVTPTHVVPQILQALAIAAGKGLCIPLVYNTSGWESESTLSILNGIIDIYLADMRYSDDRIAFEYSGIKDYVSINRKACICMHNQVGELKIEKGIAKKGLIIRHLVLPNGLSGTKGAMRFISEDISPETYVSLLSQYQPLYEAMGHPAIGRRITQDEYDKAFVYMTESGIYNGWVQDYSLQEDLEIAGVNMKQTVNKDVTEISYIGK